MASTVTAADGSYSFTNLGPGTYTVQEVVPHGCDANRRHRRLHDQRHQRQRTSSGNNFDNYKQSITPICHGDFATIGFWRNRNGQKVICSFNGSSYSTALGDWLATTFPNLFGSSNPYTGDSMAGLTNSQVANEYASLFNPYGVTKNTYVQAFATALGIYSTTKSLGGDSLLANGYARKYGFHVTSAGSGNDTVTIGYWNSPAFGTSGSMTVMQVMQTVNNNFNSSNGTFFGGDQSKTSDANDVLNGINTAGDINIIADGSGTARATSRRRFVAELDRRSAHRASSWWR